MNVRAEIDAATEPVTMHPIRILSILVNCILANRKTLNTSSLRLFYKKDMYSYAFFMNQKKKMAI